MVASGAYLLPGDVTLGMVWTLRSTAPFSARAGVDLNADGANTDYVPGTHKGQGNRDLDIGLVNAWRATRGLGPINPAQISKNDYNRVDARVSKAFSLSGKRRIEGIFQIFNLFGRDNLGGIGSSFQTNALSDSFGQLLTAQNRQQADRYSRDVLRHLFRKRIMGFSGSGSWSFQADRQLFRKRIMAASPESGR